MTLQEAITVCMEMQKWRRGEAPYLDIPGRMPFSSEVYGKALDRLISFAENPTYEAFYEDVVKKAAKWVGENIGESFAVDLIKYMHTIDVEDDEVSGTTREVPMVKLDWKTAKAIVEESDRQLEIHSKQELLFLGEKMFYITVVENVTNKLNQ